MRSAFTENLHLDKEQDLELKKHVQAIQDYLKNNLKKWDVPNESSWKNHKDDKLIHQFNLPETVFIEDVNKKIEF